MITIMMKNEKEKRPSVDDLVNNPFISIRLRESRVRDSLTKIKKREETIKQKALKVVDMELKITQLEKLLEQKDQTITEKDDIISKQNAQIEELKAKIDTQSKDYTPAPIISDTPVMSKNANNGFRKLSNINNSEQTPVPSYQRGLNQSKIDEITKSDHISVYDSLKQEIKSLSSQITLGGGSSNNVNCKLKKQISDARTDNTQIELDTPSYSRMLNDSTNNTVYADTKLPRKSCLSAKPDPTYKSVDRGSRKCQDVDKSLD